MEDNIIATAAGEYKNLYLTALGKVWELPGESVLSGKLRLVQKLKVPVVAISVGFNNCIALTKDGRVLTWGRNGAHQLGRKSKLSNTELPRPIKYEKTKFIAIAAGMQQCLALTKEGKVVTWGDNSAGQLGRRKDSSIPTDAFPKAINLPNIVAIGASARSSYALTDKGKIMAWGNNTSGQLGDLGFATSTSPKKITSINVKIKTMAIGYHHCLALDEEGKLWVWGDNSSYQLGIKKEIMILPPQIGPSLPSPVVKIAAGFYQSFALTKDGKVWGWGDNYHGEIKVRGPKELPSPVRLNKLDPLYVSAIFGPGGKVVRVKDLDMVTRQIIISSFAL